MRDVAFLALVVAFFALAAVYVNACDRIAGADDATTSGPEGLDDLEVRTGPEPRP